MKELKNSFKKNGLIYKLVDRTSKVALYSLTIKDKTIEELIGYEVCKVYIKLSHTVNGKIIEASESIPSNDQFSFDDDSKSFFPNELDRATEYLKYYSDVLTDKVKNRSNRLTIMAK